jgi:hypothetical protein
MIISGALVLDPSYDDGDNPLFGWHNLVTPANIAADAAAANYPASNMANPSTSSEWRGVTTAEQHITVTLDGVTDVDYIGVATHNFGSGRILVSIEALISAVWTEIVPAVMLPGDDAPIMWRFAKSPYAALRIRLQAGVAAPRAAVVYAGKLLVGERRIYVPHTPLPHARRTRATNGMSESGKFTGRIVTGAWRETVIPFRLISPGWYRQNMDPFLAVAAETPFFFAWRPTSYPQEIGYCVQVGDDPMPVPDSSGGNLTSFLLSVRGVA